MSERLQKFLARAGVASRRHAEGLITAGRVSVNNQRVTELGTKVEPTDLVTVDGTLVTAPERTSWYLLHKPPGVVTTLADPEGRPTVAGLLEGVEERVFPVGRLDWDAEGALLLTNDGASAHRLLHPSFEVPRTYLVKVKGAPTDETLARLREGVRLEDGPAHALRAERFERTERNTWLILQVGEGRPHLVKRLCAAVGHPVVRLFRPAQAGISVAGLQPGEVRPLTSEEVQRVEAVAAGGDVMDPVPFLPPRRHGRTGEDDEEPVASDLAPSGEHTGGATSRQRPFQPGRSGLDRAQGRGRPARAESGPGRTGRGPGDTGRGTGERRGGSRRSGPGAERGRGGLPRRGPAGGGRGESWRSSPGGERGRGSFPRRGSAGGDEGAGSWRSGPGADRRGAPRGRGGAWREAGTGRDAGNAGGPPWRGSRSEEGSERGSGGPRGGPWRGSRRGEDAGPGTGERNRGAPWRNTERGERAARPERRPGRPWRGQARGASSERGETSIAGAPPWRGTSRGRGGAGGSSWRGGPRGTEGTADRNGTGRAPGRRDPGAGPPARGQGGPGGTGPGGGGDRPRFGTERTGRGAPFTGGSNVSRPRSGAPGRGPGRGPPRGGARHGFGGPGGGKPRSGGRGRFGALPRGGSGRRPGPGAPRGGGGRGRGRP